MFSHKYRLGVLAIALAAVIVACADTAPTETTMAGMADDDHSEFSFGEPADPADADRTIEIVASDDLSFTPDAVSVEEGETILFRVVNEGQLPHDFTLGDEAAQEEHEEEMAEMEEMEHDAPNVLALEPGDTKELAWRFSEAGTVLYGCHEPGHYDAGMRGEVTFG